MSGFDFGKYRTLVISITLFLLFDLGVLILNFAISSQIKDDAINLNLVSRQRMLTQRMTKTALQIEQRIKAEQPYRDLILELDRASSTFDLTLTAYRSGGDAPAGEGQNIRRDPINDDPANQILDDARMQWIPYYASIKQLIAANPPSAEQASALARQSEVVNVWLQSLMNDFTTRVEDLASSKATKLRAVQIVGISLATMNFLLIMFHFMRHLRSSDREIERARKETGDILRTTQEGLFLLDANYRVGTQQSKALDAILGKPCPPGTGLFELLASMVTEKTLETAQEYVDLLLRHDVKEKLVANLNPLECVELCVTRSPGVSETRYVQFRFNRVMTDGLVTHLLVTATDITRRIRLERELKASEEKSQGQMGLLLQILQIEPEQMQRFLKATTEALDQINRILETQPDGVDTFSSKVNAIYRLAHRIKGDASALDLESMAQSFHAFEDTLRTLREHKNLAGEDLLPVAVRVKLLYAEIDAINNAVNRMAQIRGVVTVDPSKPVSDPTLEDQYFVKQWKSFAEKLALRHGKRAELTYQGADLTALAPVLRDAITSIVNQFIRNAIAHGIESPAERAKRGKPEAGRISVFASDGGASGVELSFRDDGHGISSNALRDTAIRTGRLSAEEADKADLRTLIPLIFEPGFSTNQTPNEDAGRGVGLDAVKDLVKQLGGHVRIGTTQGEYCHFRIHFPAMEDRVVSIPQAAREAA